MEPRGSDAPSWKESSCFTFALDTQRKRKRAKFDSSRKTEVATIRRKGACLRCRLLKTSCSEARPCDNCVRAKHSSHVQVHKWMSCVSVSLREINVFKKALSTIPSNTNDDNSELDQLADIPVCLCGESRVDWSLDGLTGDIVAWVEDRKSRGFSRTGVLASPRLQSLLEPFIGPQVSASLRSLVLSTLVVYNLGHDGGLAYVSGHREAFHLARATSAEKVLRYLEEALTASFLTRSGVNQQRLQALIIVAFGVMRSLAYFDDSEIQRNSEIGGKRKICKEGFDNATEMKDQLVSALGHFFILLLEKLGDMTLREKLPLILENVQRHSFQPFIAPLPISAPDDGSSIPSTSQSEMLNTPISLDTGLRERFGGSPDETAIQALQPAAPFEYGEDLEQILSNDLEALDFSQGNDDTKPYRECILCTSPLRADEPDALCISCLQPPSEQWPGNRVFESKESSLDTNSSRGGFLSGFNSLSTSMTSLDSVFDDLGAARERWSGAARQPLPTTLEEVDEDCTRDATLWHGHPGVVRSVLPTPVEEPEEEAFNQEDASAWMAEDMDFGESSSRADATRKNAFPSGWSLYWDDSCSEQSGKEDSDLETC